MVNINKIIEEYIEEQESNPPTPVISWRAWTFGDPVPPDGSRPGGMWSTDGGETWHPDPPAGGDDDTTPPVITDSPFGSWDNYRGPTINPGGGGGVPKPPPGPGGGIGDTKPGEIGILVKPEDAPDIPDPPNVDIPLGPIQPIFTYDDDGNVIIVIPPFHPGGGGGRPLRIKQ